MDEVDRVAYQFMLIVGTSICLLGFIGNILNIFIFASWSFNRRTNLNNNNNNNNGTSNSPLYLLTSSIANLIIIVYPLVTRIILDNYQYKVTSNEVFILCKFRYYILHTFDLISLTCICLATFDRYLISSPIVRLRQMSTATQGTKLIILSIVIINGIHSIPVAVYYNISLSGQCTIYSRIYLYYYLYMFQIFLHGIIPIIFLTIFGLLTYKQLKTLKNRGNLDKQMSRMLLLISITIILSSIPYSVEQFYNVMIFHNDYQSSSTFYLYHVISSILFYTNPVCSFYIYYISTPNFRIQVQRIFKCKKLKERFLHNQVNTITQ